MRVYLSGPMRGYPNLNFPAFDAAASYLRDNGHAVLSPAEVDRAEGFLPGTDEEAGLVSTEAHRQYMRRDIELLLRESLDAIILLPGWRRSRGSIIELIVGQALGLTVLALVGEELVEITDIVEGVLA